MDNKYFEFESYFEMTYEYSIKYSLECLDIKDIELYRYVYKKYLFEVYELSLESVNQYIRFATLNRHRLDEYWFKNKNEFLKEIIFVYES